MERITLEEDATYRRDILFDITRSRGYNVNESITAMACAINKSRDYCIKKARDGEFTRSDIVQIARYFGFTPREFAEAFFYNIFEKTVTGKIQAQTSIELLDRVERILLEMHEHKIEGIDD